MTLGIRYALRVRLLAADLHITRGIAEHVGMSLALRDAARVLMEGAGGADEPDPPTPTAYAAREGATVVYIAGDGQTVTQWRASVRSMHIHGWRHPISFG